MRRHRDLRSMTRPRLGLAAGCALLLAACGPTASEEAPLVLDEALTVRPRVVMDGLIELSARTEGRLFVDEVVFHAPGVQIRNGSETIADLLESDPRQEGALFFLYDLASDDPTGTALGGERHWNLEQPGTTTDSDVVFSFAPLNADAVELDDLKSRSGYDLTPLNGYTAYIHGYVSVAAGDVRSPFASGDPEGDPMDGTDTSGDPEGDPMDGAGRSSSGDPEGDPMDGFGQRGLGRHASGDPEGDPLKGKKASGDPEGDPMEGSGRWSTKGAAGSLARSPRMHGRPSLQGEELVPFFVVVSTEVELPVKLVDLGHADLDAGEYLPIDLHVDVDGVFTDERLESLAAEVARAGDAPALLQVTERDVGGLFNLELQHVGAKIRESKPTSGGIRVQGDPRGR